MHISIAVAADVGAEKLNVEFTFDSRGPLVGELLARAEAVFSKAFYNHGIHDQPFIIAGSMVFDDTIERWVPLERSGQLVHNAQVYLFQPDIDDSPGEIPPPVSYTEFVPPFPTSIASPLHQHGRNPSPRADIPMSQYPRPAFEFETPPSFIGGTGGGGVGMGLPGQNPFLVQAQQKAMASLQYRMVADEETMLNRWAEYQRQRANMASCSSDLPGDSILAEERRKAASLDCLDIDSYRVTMRREAAEFLAHKQPSPEHTQRRGGTPPPARPVSTDIPPTYQRDTPKLPNNRTPTSGTANNSFTTATSGSFGAHRSSVRGGGESSPRNRVRSSSNHDDRLRHRASSPQPLDLLHGIQHTRTASGGSALADDPDTPSSPPSVGGSFARISSQLYQ